MKRFGWVLALAMLTSAALAQSAPTPAKPAAPSPPAPAPAPAVGPPAYTGQLARLAEIFGALTYLRDLCGAGDGAKFRDRMAKLIEAESAAPESRDSLAGAFNRGFGDYELTYRRCTTSARETIATYLEESSRIAREVATRYGG